MRTYEIKLASSRKWEAFDAETWTDAVEQFLAAHLEIQAFDRGGRDLAACTTQRWQTRPTRFQRPGKPVFVAKPTVLLITLPYPVEIVKRQFEHFKVYNASGVKVAGTRPTPTPTATLDEVGETAVWTPVTLSLRVVE